MKIFMAGQLAEVPSIHILDTDGKPTHVEKNY
jgi:hypothetical protein